MTLVAVSKSKSQSNRPQGQVHLWGATTDAVLLGGASIVAFLIIRTIEFSEESLAALFMATTVLAHFVNHPHFAHSYQIFYASLGDVRAGRWGSDLSWRWWWAGVIAPLLLLISLGFAAWQASVGDTLWIALSLNLMGALVGWHYVKQGFGMAMTDAALKKRFWPPRVRLALLTNAYLCWAAAWVGLNSTKAAIAYWGFFSLEFHIPASVIVIAWVACLASTCTTALLVTRALQDFRRRDPVAPLPYSGLLAYVVSLYLWTLFAWVDPAYLLVIPLFHSLQYLTVVWRYKWNEWSTATTGRRPYREAASFASRGVALGALGFWLAPSLVDFARTGHFTAGMGQTSIGLACAWLFINVHHYLLDNVMWRKGNPSAAKHLFGYVG